MKLVWARNGAVGLLLASASVLTGSSLDEVGVSPDAMLSDGAGFTPAQRADIERGRIVAEVLDSTDRTEVISVAAMRVRTTAGRVLACARDPACFRRSDDLMEVGVLGAGSELADLARLSLDPRHLKAIRDCQLTACEIRLSEAAIQQFHRDVDWKEARHPEQAACLFRRNLASQGVQYRVRGNVGLPVYHDKPFPSSVAASLRELLKRRFFPLEEAPDLARGLAEFPAFIPPHSDNLIAWVKERFWRKVLVSLHHVTLADLSRGSEERVLVTSKQIYASHFFESSVEVTLFIRRPSDGDRGWLIFLSRSRTDIRPTGFTWFERLLLKRLVRGRLQGQLGRLRDQLETPQAVHGAPVP